MTGAAPERTPSLRARIIGFGGLPLLSMITPLLVMPFLARAAGDAGWASVGAGESMGAIFGLLVSYGWHSIGPTRVPPLRTRAEKVSLYRDSLAVRLALALAVLPVMCVVTWSAARDGWELMTTLMAASTATVPLSLSWYAVGTGRADHIAAYETLPRVGAAAVSAVVIVTTGWILIYPILATVVPLTGMTLFSVRELRTSPGPWPRGRAFWRLFRRDAVPAANEAAAGAYAALPLPIVNHVASSATAAGYASADKLYRYGSFVPGALANIFQRWVTEGDPAQYRQRQRRALRYHLLLGVAGLAALTLLGPWVSAVLFGDAVTAAREICFALGWAFVLNSFRMGATRLVLFPAGRTTVILRSTLIGGVVGSAAVAALAVGVGPLGAAGGLVLSEAIMTALLVPGLRLEWTSGQGAREAVGDAS